MARKVTKYASASGRLFDSATEADLFDQQTELVVKLDECLPALLANKANINGAFFLNWANAFGFHIVYIGTEEE